MVSDARKNIFLFACAVALGSLFSLILFNDAILPTHTEWIVGEGRIDPGVHYFGWLFFKNDPEWHFPLTITTDIFYPTGLSIAYTDSIPIFALLAKAMVEALEIIGFDVGDFQYFGLVLTLNVILQIFFAIKIVDEVNKDKNLLILVSSGCLLALMPSMLRRGFGHIALTSHWLLLCSLWLYLKTYRRQGLGNILLPQAILIAIAAGVHPYLAIMTTLICMATCIKVFLSRAEVIYVKAVVSTSLVALWLILWWYFFGYFSQGSSAFRGVPFGYYSMNLLSPIDSNGSSIVWPNLPAATDGQASGFNYLGLGVILLIISAISLHKKAFQVIFSKPNRPLLFVCICLTLFALSTNITVGRVTLLTVDPPDRIDDLLRVFHASGRMFWPVSYAIAALYIGLLVKNWPSKVLMVLFPLLLTVQIVDITPMTASLIERMNDDASNADVVFVSEEWQHLGEHHSKLIVVPSYQCDRDATPGGTFLPFARLAVSQGLALNTFKSARISPQIRDVHCRDLQDEVLSGFWEFDAAYVLSEDFYQNVLAQVGSLGTHSCQDIDGLILCQNSDSTTSSQGR